MSQNGVISAFPPALASPELLHCQGSRKLMAFYQQWHKSHLLGCARAEVTFLQTLSPAGLNKVFLQELRGCQGKMNCSSWRETCSTVIWLLHSNWDGGGVDRSGENGLHAQGCSWARTNGGLSLLCWGRTMSSPCF